VARVRQLTGDEFQLTMTGTELALIKTSLGEAERVSRFGIEVLDDVDRARDGHPAGNSRLEREIGALMMREASLKSLQKTMSEIASDAGPVATRHADLDQFRSGAALPVPPPR
jgi:hypothetical protein